MRILVVDDDYVSRVKLSRLLLTYGHCDNAPNGEIAMRLFECAHRESAPYNLVTMDVEMPEMSGQEVVMRMRAMEKSWGTARNLAAKVLMVTAKESVKDVVSAYDEGCDGYLAKPIRPDRLIKALIEIGVKV
jgi:two-component system, chemotaxis family, chemotaxis protein CheY